MATAAKGNTRVLVTGASGYLGIHCVQQLLREGYITRGTVRSATNEVKIKPLRDLEGGDKLELVEADLCDDKGWAELILVMIPELILRAVKDCTYILHVASPFPMGADETVIKTTILVMIPELILRAVKDCTYILHVASPFPMGADETVIKTAVDGTLRVLKAAAAQPTVKKVVLTSSCAAINEGHDDHPDRVFDEKDWTDVESKSVLNYSKSKTLAEKAAWDFVNKESGVNFKLTVINPTLIVGPLLHNVQGTSITVIRRFLNFEMPMVPHMEMGLVDVRDVVSAHVKSMTNPKTDGERILVTAQPSMTFLQIANCLRKEFGSQGYYLPRLEVPYPVLWMYSFFDRDAQEALTRVGRQINFDNSKAKKLLNMEFIDPKQSIVAMAYDIIERGMVPKRRQYHGPPAETS